MNPLVIKGLGVVLATIGGFLVENAGKIVEKVNKKGVKR